MVLKGAMGNGYSGDVPGAMGDVGSGGGEEHGGLVQKILETKNKDDSAATSAKTQVTVVSALSSWPSCTL